MKEVRKKTQGPQEQTGAQQADQLPLEAFRNMLGEKDIAIISLRAQLEQQAAEIKRLQAEIVQLSRDKSETKK